MSYCSIPSAGDHGKVDRVEQKLGKIDECVPPELILDSPKQEVYDNFCLVPVKTDASSA